MDIRRIEVKRLLSQHVPTIRIRLRPTLRLRRIVSQSWRRQAEPGMSTLWERSSTTRHAPETGENRGNQGGVGRTLVWLRRLPQNGLHPR